MCYKKDKKQNATAHNRTVYAVPSVDGGDAGVTGTVFGSTSVPAYRGALRGGFHPLRGVAEDLPLRVKFFRSFAEQNSTHLCGKAGARGACPPPCFLNC